MGGDGQVPGAADPARLAAVGRAFVGFAIAAGALGFGRFTLKSGRQSPYFYNSGVFADGASLDRLGSFYAEAWMASGLRGEVLFGPAYKGIPLAVATGAALAREHGVNPGVTFNRKEVKDHGEGGHLVGASLAGRDVVLVDDVMSAGTAVREAVGLVRAAGGRVCGILLALDREERGQGAASAVQEAAASLGVPVVAIARLSDLVAHLEAEGSHTADLDALRAYRAAYGVDSV